MFAQIELNTIKSMLLHLLANHAETPTMYELQQELFRSPANLAQLVDDMENSGWIQRIPSPTDRRVKLIQLTDSGRSKNEEAETRMAMIMHVLLADIPDDEILPLMRNLMKLGNTMINTLSSGESLLPGGESEQ